MSVPPPIAGTPTSSWTADELWAYYERQPTTWPRYELVDGELLVTPAPAPRHHYVLQALMQRVWDYLRAERVGVMFWSPADLRVAFGTVVQPDLFVMAWRPGTRKPLTWEEVGRVLLTVEILSPSTARHDRLVKRRYYARRDVPEYWILDPDTRMLERSFPDGRVDVLDDRLEWHPEGARRPLVLDLRALFAEALDDVAEAPP